MLAPNSEIVRTKSSSWGILAVHCWIIALLLLSVLLYTLFDPAPEHWVYPACLFLAGLTIWALWSWQVVTKSWFDPYMLFFSAATLFNGGQALLELFRLNRGGILNGLFSAEVIVQTLLLVLLALASFHFGALLSSITSKKAVQDATQKVSMPELGSIRWVGWGLLLVSFFPMLFVLKDALSVVISSGYFGLFQAAQNTGYTAAPQILASFLVPGTLFLLAGSREKRRGIVVSATVIVSYSMLQFVLGARAAAAMPLIAYIWLWHRCLRPLPKTFLIGLAAVILLIVFPVIRVIRDSSGAERSLEDIFNAILLIENPAITIISEMGFSMSTIAYTIEFIPGIRKFDLGAQYFYSLLTAVPNLFWDIHPAIVHGLPSSWLIWNVNPYIARLGGGLGYSFIAEAYFNFGWIGTPITLGIFGFLFGKLSLWAAHPGNPARMALMASFLAFVLFWVRQEATYVVRPLLWYSLTPYLSAYVVQLLRSRSAERKTER